MQLSNQFCKVNFGYVARVAVCVKRQAMGAPGAMAAVLKVKNSFYPL